MVFVVDVDVDELFLKSAHNHYFLTTFGSLVAANIKSRSMKLIMLLPGGAAGNTGRWTEIF